MTSTEADSSARSATAPVRGPLRDRGSGRWIPPVAALLVAAAGVLDLVSALSPANRPRVQELTQFVPGSLTNAATAATAVAGVLLLLLAHGLRRRKRRAWRGALVLLGASILLHVVKGLDIEEATVSTLLLAGLLWHRDQFYAKGDPRTRWRALYAFAGLLVTSVLVGFVLIRIRLGVVVGPHSLGDQLRHVLLGLVGVQGPLRFRFERSTEIVNLTLAAFGALTVLVPAYLVLRPAEPQPLLTEDDERRLRDLLDRHGGRDSLGYFALRRDKSVVWSPTGKAAVAYRVVSGVALASGDPIGDPEAWPGALQEFLALAAEHAWVPAVMGCGEQGGTAYRRAGLQVLEIGDEAVVEVDGFTLEGRAMRGVRQAVNRVERAGYTTRVRRVGDITAAERDQIRSVTASWRAGDTERGFSMALGRFGEPADECCVLVTAEQHGVLRGLLHFVPWGRDGLSLDLMRRDRTADNGVNELLIVHAVQAGPQLGLRRLSLNFAVFRQAFERGERLGAGPLVRGWRGLLLFVSRWFQIESLYRFNAKFRPTWEPRYVCYPSAADLPRVALAALEAEAFVVWPRLPLAPSRQPLARLLRILTPTGR